MSKKSILCIGIIGSIALSVCGIITGIVIADKLEEREKTKLKYKRK